MTETLYTLRSNCPSPLPPGPLAITVLLSVPRSATILDTPCWFAFEMTNVVFDQSKNRDWRVGCLLVLCCMKDKTGNAVCYSLPSPSAAEEGGGEGRQAVVGPSGLGRLPGVPRLPLRGRVPLSPSQGF